MNPGTSEARPLGTPSSGIVSGSSSPSTVFQPPLRWWTSPVAASKTMRSMKPAWLTQQLATRVISARAWVSTASTALPPWLRASRPARAAAAAVVLTTMPVFDSAQRLLGPEQVLVSREFSLGPASR